MTETEFKEITSEDYTK
ncbi:hypothetical protein KQI18_10640 [Clostridioides mangenotii]|nr:hypothetical protein [Clostridioides mangenotii]